MKFFLMILFLTQFAVAQVIDVQWNNQFRKELSITCSAGENFCSELCASESACVITEGYCKDCIGTGLKMNYLLSEIGGTILSSGVSANRNKFLQMLKNNEFISLTSQDVYNVIDPAQSIRTIKKFEKLCPSDSVAQIVFVRVDKVSRELKNPEFVYCDQFDYVEILNVTMKPKIEIQVNPLW